MLNWKNRGTNLSTVRVLLYLYWNKFYWVHVLLVYSSWAAQENKWFILTVTPSWCYSEHASLCVGVIHGFRTVLCQLVVSYQHMAAWIGSCNRSAFLGTSSRIILLVSRPTALIVLCFLSNSLWGKCLSGYCYIFCFYLIIYRATVRVVKL